MAKYCVGIDIGGTTVKSGLFRTDGMLAAKWEIPTRTENNGVSILRDTAAAMRDWTSSLGIAWDSIEGIGVGIPAPVRKDGAVHIAANLGWRNKNARRELEELTCLPSFFINDANAAALGEMWQGAGRGRRDILMVTIGTGIGAGIVSNGRILEGAHGSAGELGHTHVRDNESEECGCGNCGCLEQYASATGMVRVARTLLEESLEPSLLRESGLTAKSIFECAAAGDILAEKAARISCRYLAAAIANAAVIIDPEICVIGGGVSKAGQILLDYIMEYYREISFVSVNKMEFASAELGNDAGIYGAARLLLDEAGYAAAEQNI